MNRSLPPRARGNRDLVARWQSRCGRLAPGALGLVHRASHPPKRKKPPGRSPAANPCRAASGFDRVAELSVFGLRGNDVQAHLLPDGPGQEPANGMRLPARGFHQVLGGGAARPLQQFKESGCLTAIAGGAALLFALARFGRFLRRGGLLTRLALLGRDVRATFGNTGGFGSFRLPSYAGGRRFCLFCDCDHLFSFGGDYRAVVNMNHSGRRTMQGNSAHQSMAMISIGRGWRE